MIPSSIYLPKLCSNNKCCKLTNVLREAWVCENNRKVDLCNACYVSFRRGKFCKVHHEDMSDWKTCISCPKEIHYGCPASQKLYVHVQSEPSKEEIRCLDCSPVHEILPNFEDVGGRLMAPQGRVASPPLVIRSSDDSFPRARVPLIVVGKGKEKVVSDQKGDRTPPRLFLEYKGESSTTTTSDQAKAFNRKHRNKYQYAPSSTDQELKQMSRGSKVEATPLFEKVLTVSDARKSGRLVIPKKCAEDHFPPIGNIPEGIPLVFEDGEGKEWKFHFRYWPNNNSRMYVLEDFNNYITSMKLQAGDTVTFSTLIGRGGKLVIGHRKSTSDSSSRKDVGLFQKPKTTSPSSRKAKMNSVPGSKPIPVPFADQVEPKASVPAKRKFSEMDTLTKMATIGPLKDKTTSAHVSSTVSHENPNDPINDDLNVLGSKSPVRANRKNREMSMLTPSTSKRLSKPRTILAMPSIVSQKKPNNQTNVVGKKAPIHRKRKLYDINLTTKSTEHEEKMGNLALSFQRGQKLIQSRPGSNPPSNMFFDGVELESYKDDPIIGRPSMFTTLDQYSTQWAQCEKCCKWRKVSVEDKIPANWTCRQNQRDLLRSRCSAKEELTRDMINSIFPAKNQGSSKKIKTVNIEQEQVETVDEPVVVVVTAVENAVVLPDLPKANKKHPRHRPGCACIVCMQAPSGSKHKPSCECCSCKTGRRRRVLNPRRGKKRSKNAARRKTEKTKRSTSNRKTEKAHRKPENVPNLAEIETSNSNLQMVALDGSEIDQKEKKASDSETKYQFDLNLVPELDEDDI